MATKKEDKKFELKESIVNVVNIEGYLNRKSVIISYVKGIHSKKRDDELVSLTLYDIENDELYSVITGGVAVKGFLDSIDSGELDKDNIYFWFSKVHNSDTGMDWYSPNYMNRKSYDDILALQASLKQRRMELQGAINMIAETKNEVDVPFSNLIEDTVNNE